jgi:hypothetical protein
MTTKKPPAGLLPNDSRIRAVRAILMEQIELAKPDDLAFLESQVDYIARCIVDRLCSQRGP